ncbi:hypothetical protein TH61_05455 [Rufibacter sp. DG15C]|uniref:Uncharacterized protein n=1 Tax=Nibribacter koreensis TaxID=1084519 RepID=A0ABP8G3C5_9BACT|nr:hypothetical protein TH61_05455 [Rufibacter sp. DG15C]
MGLFLGYLLMMRMTGLSAFSASLCTPLAMLILVLAAFLSAQATDFFAQDQVLMADCRLALQQRYGVAARVCASPVQLGTLGHHPPLRKAMGKAHLAGAGTG